MTNAVTTLPPSTDNYSLTLSNGVLLINETSTIADLTIMGSATVTHSETDTSNTYSMEFAVTGNLDIQSGGKIDVSSRGYLGGYSGGNNSTYGRTSGNTTTDGSSDYC